MNPSLPRWSATTYAANAGHHRLFDERVLGPLEIAEDAAVLDVGCGSGHLTARLAELAPRGRVVGLDAEPDMVAYASRTHLSPNLRFVCGLAQQVDALPEVKGPFDLAISTAALHWVPEDDHPAVLAGIAGVMRSGGVLRIDCGGHGQIAAPRAILNEESRALGGPVDPWYFPRAEEYAELLGESGFTVDHAELIIERRPMPDRAALTGWLRSQVTNAYDPGLPAQHLDRFRSRVEQRAVRELERADGSYDLDYVRLDVLARRP